MESLDSNVLVVSFSPLDHDPRVRRQLFALSERGCQLTAAGYTDPNIDGVAYWPVKCGPSGLAQKLFKVLLLKLRLFSLYYRRMDAVRGLVRVWEQENRPAFDLVVANDIDALPVALELANGAPVFFDAHEFSPGEWGSWTFDFIFRRYRQWQCSKYLGKATAMSTVCLGIAETYAKEFGIGVPEVIMNAPRYSDIRPKPVDHARIRLVHHGAALVDRRLEVMIDMLSLLDERFSLDFYLMTDFAKGAGYRDELKSRADALHLGDRVSFLDPVPTEDIPATISQYDIGVYPLQPKCLNEELALPNKFFEFIQARLAIAIGPSTEMARVLREHDLGVVAEDFSAEAMAKAISSLTPQDIQRFKGNADVAAKALSFDAQAPKFLKVVENLLRNG